jgi:hypothetical protein
MALWVELLRWIGCSSPSGLRRVAKPPPGSLSLTRISKDWIEGSMGKVTLELFRVEGIVVFSTSA